MPEDEVAPQGTPESQRPLEVDGIAGLEPAERRPRERLGPELEDDLVLPALDHRQDAPFTATLAPTSLPSSVTPACTPSRSVVPARASATTVPISSTIPVNIYSTSGGAASLPPTTPHRPPKTAASAHRLRRPRRRSNRALSDTLLRPLWLTESRPPPPDVVADRRDDERPEPHPAFQLPAGPADDRGRRAPAHEQRRHEDRHAVHNPGVQEGRVDLPATLDEDA